MTPWFWYAIAAAVLYGLHQVFTKLAADHISDGLGGLVVEGTAAVTIAAYLIFLWLSGTWTQKATTKHGGKGGHMKPACFLWLLLVPATACAGDTCDVTGARFHDDIGLRLQYGAYTPVLKSCAEVEVMNTSAGNRLTVYITAHFKDGNYQKEGFSGSYVERGETRTHRMCWDKDRELDVFTCEF